MCTAQIGGHRTPDAPILGQEGGHNLGVDRLAIAGADGVLAQQHDRIDQVFFVELDNLHLLEATRPAAVSPAGFQAPLSGRTCENFI
jgi:hypothetical protein